MVKLNKVPFEFEAKAEKALFLAPEDKNHAYLAPTYSTLRYLCECIYWTPDVEWMIDQVRIMNHINMNRQTGALSDVRYQVKAHMVWNGNGKGDNASVADTGRILSIAQRALKKGGRREAYMGKSTPSDEFLATIQPCSFGESEGAYDLIPEIRLGEMFHSTSYPSQETDEKTFHFFDCVVREGVIDFPKVEECKIQQSAHYWKDPVND